MVDALLTRVYKQLLDREPEGMEDWQLAEAIVQNFNGQLFDEDTWQEVFFLIVNHVRYPDIPTTQRIVGQAEDYYSELMGIEDEPHMARIEADEYAKRYK